MDNKPTKLERVEPAVKTAGGSLAGYQAERYSLPAVPGDHWLNWFSDTNMNGVTLAWRNDGRWAVIRGRYSDGGMVWHKVDGWVYEPSPSNRSDDFKRSTRFPLDVAAAIGRDRAADMLAEMERRYADDDRIVAHRLEWQAAHGIALAGSA